MPAKDSDIDGHHHHREMLPVWFFIGVLLLTYGLIILYAGIRDLYHPAQVMFANYHASLWGGGLLTLLGIGYTVSFYPRPKKPF